MITEKIKIGGNEIFCRIVGTGSPLIVLHNGFYSQDTWDCVIDSLALNHTVYSYDRYGYGHSTHLVEFTGDIVEFGVDELECLVNHYHLKNISLLGHCLGGAIALLFATRHPELVENVIAESVGLYSDDNLQVKTDWTFLPYEQTHVSLRRKLVSMHGEDYAEVFWNAIRVYKGGYIMNPDYDITETVQSIKKPVLFIVGDRDFYFDIPHTLAVYKSMKNAQFAVIPNTGHDVHVKSTELFLKIVDDFFNKKNS